VFDGDAFGQNYPINIEVNR